MTHTIDELKKSICDVIHFTWHSALSKKVNVPNTADALMKAFSIERTHAAQNVPNNAWFRVCYDDGVSGGIMPFEDIEKAAEFYVEAKSKGFEATIEIIYKARNAVGDDEHALLQTICHAISDTNGKNASLAEYSEAVLKALRAAGYVQSQWQPIETAPKDGTVLLVAGGTVEWRVDSYAPTNSTGAIGGWFSHSAQKYLQWQPTHWMPLPKPPEAVTKQTQENEGSR